MRYIILIMLFWGSHSFCREPIFLYNLKGEAERVTYLDTCSIIVLMNGWSCADCFKSLDSALFLIGNEKIKKSLLIQVKNSNIITKRNSLVIARQYFSDDSFKFFFEVVSKNNANNEVNHQSEIFSNYDIKVTPSLLISKSDKIKYLDFKDLFGTNYDAEAIKYKILEVLQTFNH